MPRGVLAPNISARCVSNRKKDRGWGSVAHLQPPGHRHTATARALPDTPEFTLQPAAPAAYRDDLLCRSAISHARQILQYALVISAVARQ
jgi:hypothetical protein